ncbi:MAG: calcium-binding protein [Hyphomicrobiales bacterium]|nr:MAG: calcium-binding protein [Hyphomicrobiales bacterium]
MSEIFDVINIFLLILAVGIFIALRNVLGRRTGNERPPFDPYSATRDEAPQDQPAAGDNVITLPRGDDAPVAASADNRIEEKREHIDAVAAEGTALNEALRSILSADRAFDPKDFVKGAVGAYEMIVAAFAEGDRRSLKQLLSRDVYDGFVGAIADRESRKETLETTFVGLDKAEIVEAALRDGTAQVTVRFKSQLISVTRDSEGRIIDGDPNKLEDVTDIWTFAREVASRDPNWKLVATETAE